MYLTYPDPFFDLLEKMSRMIENKEDHHAIEEYFYSLASKENSLIADKIKNINLSNYKKLLKTQFSKAIDIAKRTKMSAIYFEYDMFNEWDSGFYLCKYYVPKDKLDDKNHIEDWRCWFEDEVIRGPNLEEFSTISITIKSNPIELYLIARTVASFLEVYKSISTDNMAICIAFHDQINPFRVQEYNPPAERLYDESKVIYPTPIIFTELENYIRHNYNHLLTQIKNEENIKVKIEKALIKYKNEIFINYCPFCHALRKTPRAKLCLSCQQMSQPPQIN